MPLLYLPAGATSTPVTSTDGVITAVPDPANLSVLVRVHYTSSVPAQVTVWRTTGGQKVAVRSGQDVAVIGGYAFAYDHEARPGVSYTYAAERLDTHALSGGATVSLGWTANTDAVIRSVNNPTLSRKVRLIAPYAETFEGRQALVGVPGARAPHAVVDVPAAITTALTVRTTTKADYDAIAALVADPDVKLIQATDAHPLPGDIYALITSWSTSRPDDLPGYQAVDHVISIQGMDRPDVTGAPMRMPRWGWTEAVAAYGTMTSVVSAYPTMWDLMLAGVGV